jgi:hypothetical protein
MLVRQQMEGNMADSSKISRLFIWFVAITVSGSLCGLCNGGEEAGDEMLTANVITSVASYPLDHLSGSMALHALHSVLRAQGVTGSYEELVGISGSVFKVVYDSSDSFEPLRDTCPFDLLRAVAVRSGFPDAHWETGLTGEDLRQVVKHEIDAGRPLVSPFLKPDAYHGFNIITGYDYDRNQFKVQGAFNRRRAYSVPIPESWDGPTVSPAGWATNPVFVLGEAVDDSAMMADVYVDMADQGMEFLQGGTLVYGLQEGETRYMARPGPHEARYGLPAYDVLAWDVEHADIVVKSQGQDALNFALLWRIDAMVGLLEHDRLRGPEFASLLRGVLSQQQAPALYDLVVNFERTAEDAAALRSFFRHEIPDTLTDPRAVLEYIERSGALVFALPDQEGLAAGLRDLGRDVYESLWGWVMVEDSPGKRIEAKMKVISIRSRDLKCLDLMGQLADDIRSKGEREWPPRKWRPRRLKQE